jgi:hypothetical protein
MPKRATGARPLPILLLLAAALAGCAPTYLAESPNGDRTVTTYSRAFGLDATKLNNREAVLEACGKDEPIIFGEQFGTDDNGVYRRWEFGCAAAAPAEPPR